MTGSNGHASPPPLPGKRKRSWLGILLMTVGGAVLLLLASVLWRLSVLPPIYQSAALIGIKEASIEGAQNDEMYRWVKATLAGDELKEQVFKMMALRHPDTVLKDVRIGTRFGSQPQTLDIVAEGQGANAQQQYLNVLLEKLLQMREESTVAGDLRVLERPTASIELQRFSVKDAAGRMADRLILGE